MLRVPHISLVVWILWGCCRVVVGQDGDEHGDGIHWEGLNVYTSGLSSSDDKNYILHPSTGSVANGRMCGILGPSGAGKSTFLAALAGTTSKNSGLHIEGSVWMETNDTKANLSIRTGEVAFLQQQDVFFSMLTPRETIELAAFLELPHSSSQLERAALVEKSLLSLGLSSVQNRTIGDRSLNNEGLSGGERRRLSVALELITSPRLLLADEATTGLDSTQAQKVVNLIFRLARELNIPCVLSLHQPRASIWKLLDSFILMAPGGLVCYMGSRRAATKYFSKLGYECPDETNPAEFFIDLVSIDTEDPFQGEKDVQRIVELAKAFKEHTAKQLRNHSTYSPETNVSVFKTQRSTLFRPLRRLSALLLRSWRQNVRNSRVNALRLVASIGQAVLLSQVFKTVRKGVPTAMSVADRTALLSFGVINMCMLALTKTLDLFAKERGVVMREQTRKQYSSWEYLLAKAIAEVPLDTCFAAIFAGVLKATTGLRISLSQLAGTFSLMTVAGASLGFAIGSISPTPEAALATGVPYLVILMCVSVINPSGVDTSKPPPAIIRYLKTISPIRWAIEALCVAEYKGMVFEGSESRFPWQKLRDLPKMGAFVMVKDGDQILSALGLDGARYSVLMSNLAKLSAVQLLFSWLGLHYGGPQFVEADTKLESKSSPGGAWKTQSIRNEKGFKNSTESLKIPVVRIV